MFIPEWLVFIIWALAALWITMSFANIFLFIFYNVNNKRYALYYNSLLKEIKEIKKDIEDPSMPEMYTRGRVVEILTLIRQRRINVLDKTKDL